MADAVECPECGSTQSQVVDSRPRDTPIPHFLRRRRCACGVRYKTREFLDNVEFSNFIDANGLSGRDKAIVQALVNNIRTSIGEE